MNFPSEKENANKSIAWKVSTTTPAKLNSFQPQLNCPYLAHAIIWLKFKNCKQLKNMKKICAYSADEHVHQNFEVNFFMAKESLFMFASQVHYS